MVRKPRRARKTSSGPAHMAKLSKVRRNAGQVRALADTSPSSRSELPDRYLVPASIARSTPRSCGGNSSGVAQVLSMSTTAPCRCAAAAMAGMSCISKDCEPGASVNTAVVFGRSSASMPAPSAGS